MADQKPRHRGRVWIVTGLVLIAAALCLTGYNLWDNARAAASVNMKLDQLKKIIPEQQPLEELQYPDYVLNPDMEMPVEKIDGYDYIGVLEIPELELSLPIMSDWSYPKLKIAPCRYVGSAYKDNLIIAAHNYTTHFGRLKELAMGNPVKFTDMDGNEFNYVVSEIEQLNPTAIEEMEAGDWALTLFTCTIGGQYRVVVRCILADDAGDLWNPSQGKG